MAEFHSLGLTSGLWRGTLTTGAAPGDDAAAPATPPRLLLVHLGRVIAQPRLTARAPGEWQVETAIPPEALSDGTHTLLLLADAGQGEAPPQPGAERLAVLPIIAGEPLEDDLRAEIELLRAELDLLKRAFRRRARDG